MGMGTGTGVGSGMGMGHSAWERPGHGHGDHKGRISDGEALRSSHRDAQGGYSRTGKHLAQGECPSSCSALGYAVGIPRDTYSTGEMPRDTEPAQGCPGRIIQGSSQRWDLLLAEAQS